MRNYPCFLRNHLYRCTLLLALLFASFFLWAQPQESKGLFVQKQEEERPNVILIITDDQGYGDLGYHHNPDIQTPVLDDFARKAVRFSNFYVSPVCAPTRASLMTGRYNIRTGVFDTYSGGAIMAAHEVTMAEVFRDAGYATGLFGKWHLGDSYPSRPQDQGFTTSVWHLSGGIGQVGDVFNHHEGDSAYFDPMLWKNGEQYQSQGYCSDVFTDEAIQFISKKQDDPFFVYLSFNAPHTPLQVPERYYHMYKDKEISPEYFRKQGLYTHDMSEGDIEAARKVYAMVTNIDDNLERLFNALEKQKLDQNTIIIFMTDNGPQQHRFTGGFRGRKSMVREGGIHVPFYIKLPKEMARVKEVSQPTAHIDVLPTLAALCKIGLPEDLDIDGKNLAPLLEGQPASLEGRTLFFEWQRSYPEKYRNMAAIRGAYKLTGNTGLQEGLSGFELYDLGKDPFEAENIIAQAPDMARELKKELDVWYADIMQSPHINTLPRIMVGSEKENPVILNRNDARGMQLIWAQDDIHVSWDVTIASEGDYQVHCYFREDVEKAGHLLFRIGNKNVTLENEQPGVRKLIYDKIHLKKGDFTIDGWYLLDGGGFLTPFYIEIEKLE